ncbi:hypothetical protein D5S17_11745 [Pseudonocardiaceae bacterium YIM PH 21723]|nr:hypothetical protein D5S17_11745 [Pseudonocardiaceae bacterium YIM PH 21723]
MYRLLIALVFAAAAALLWLYLLRHYSPKCQVQAVEPTAAEQERMTDLGGRQTAPLPPAYPLALTAAQPEAERFELPQQGRHRAPAPDPLARLSRFVSMGIPRRRFPEHDSDHDPHIAA